MLESEAKARKKGLIHQLQLLVPKKHKSALYSLNLPKLFGSRTCSDGKLVTSARISLDAWSVWRYCGRREGKDNSKTDLLELYARLVF